MATVLKTVVSKGTVSSNLTVSANVVKIQQNDFKNQLTLVSKDSIINTWQQTIELVATSSLKIDYK